MRTICKIEVKNDFVVKGIQFEGVRKVCTFADAAARCERAGIEEIFLVDMTKSTFSLPPNFDALEAMAELTHLPITFGGGIRSLDDAMRSFELGAARVYLNTAVFEINDIIENIAAVCGRQAVVGGAEYRHVNGEARCFRCAGREATEVTVAERVRQVMDAGVSELLISSIDRDGTEEGFDWEVTGLFDEVPLPVVLSGGGSDMEMRTRTQHTRPEGLAFSSVVLLQ